MQITLLKKERTSAKIESEFNAVSIIDQQMYSNVNIENICRRAKKKNKNSK